MNDKSQYLHVVCNNYKLTKHVWWSACRDTFTYRPPTTNVRWGGEEPTELGTQEGEWVTDPLALLRAGRGSGTEMLCLFQHTRWWKKARNLANSMSNNTPLSDPFRINNQKTPDRKKY